MRAASEGHRQHLLDGLRRFAVSVRELGGVRRIALLGSIVTAKPDPKDIDVLVVVADDADLAALATCARRLQGHARASIEAPTCLWRTNVVRTSDERADGKTADLVCGRHAMRCIAVGGPTSTTISMRFA